MRLLFITMLVLVCISSCGEYKMIVNRKNVMYDKNGYMCITGKRAFFVESKDSLLNLQAIFKQVDNNTFWLPIMPKDQYHAFKLTANKDTLINLYDDPTSHGIVDTVHFIYIRLRAYPDITESFVLESKADSKEIFSYYKIRGKVYMLGNKMFDQNIVYYYPVIDTESQLYIINLKELQKY